MADGFCIVGDESPRRRRSGPRPSYLDPELMSKVAAAGDARLLARIEAQKQKESFEVAVREKSEDRKPFLSNEVLDKLVEEHTEFFRNLSIESTKAKDIEIVTSDEPPAISSISVEKSREISERGRRLLLDRFADVHVETSEIVTPNGTFILTTTFSNH